LSASRTGSSHLVGDKRSYLLHCLNTARDKYYNDI
jgi:hypothetical protein